MYCKEPSKRRFWRLADELIKEGVWEESDSESDVEEDNWSSESDSEFDTEDDWVMEQIIFGEMGDSLYQ